MSRQDGAAMVGWAALAYTSVASFPSGVPGAPARFQTAVAALRHDPVHWCDFIFRLPPKPASRRTIW
jgi:hypothetical protein